MQEELDHHQLKTLYPYSRSDVFQMFKREIDPFNQKLFDAEQSVFYILKQLEFLKKIYENWALQVYPGLIDTKFKTMNRKIYLSFRCSQCSNNFASLLGNFQIKFSNAQNSNQFVYDCKIYKMKCIICHQWCEGKILESQLQAVAKSFCIIIAQILECLPKPEITDDRHKHRQVHFHQQQLCEACIKEKCFNIPKGENFISNPTLEEILIKKYSIPEALEKSESSSQELQQQKEQKIQKVQKKQQTYAQYQIRKKLEKISRRAELGLTKKKKSKKNNAQKNPKKNILPQKQKAISKKNFKKEQQNNGFSYKSINLTCDQQLDNSIQKQSFSSSIRQEMQAAGNLQKINKKQEIQKSESNSQKNKNHEQAQQIEGEKRIVTSKSPQMKTSVQINIKKTFTAETSSNQIKISKPKIVYTVLGKKPQKQPLLDKKQQNYQILKQEIQSNSSISKQDNSASTISTTTKTNNQNKTKWTKIKNIFKCCFPCF